MDKSLKDYLISDRVGASPSSLFGMDSASAHATIAGACLEYLLRFNGPEKLTSESQGTYSFLEYAARYWHAHARALTQAPDKQEKPLIERGADETERTKSDATVLHLAVESQNQVMVDLFVGLGIDMDAVDNWYDTAVFRAVYKGHLQVLQRLVECGADPAKSKTLTGVKPLEIAALKGHTDIVRYLLDQSVDPNAANLQGGTALHQAANHGHVEILRLLLERGANINASIEQAGNHSVLHMAVMDEEKEALKELLAWKAPPFNLQARDEEGDTPLHYTVLQKNLEMTEILLSHGADPNALGLGNCSPLELVV